MRRLYCVCSMYAKQRKLRMAQCAESRRYRLNSNVKKSRCRFYGYFSGYGLIG